MAAPPASSLLQKVWRIPEAGRVGLVRPARARLQNLDKRWGQLRKEGDLAHDWAWESVFDDPELFLLRTREQDVERELAVWRSGKGVITLEQKRFYRLDNIEVNPDDRGGVVGRFLVALIGSRAHELGTGVVLACPEGLVKWYESQGAKPGTDLGWKYPKELRVLKFEADAVRKLKEIADALEDKK